jgi:hypothetical protein
MGMNALACGECGAGLPPPDASGTSSCVYCGTEHRERSSEVFAAAIPVRPQSSGMLVSDRPSWHDGEDAASIPMTEDAVLHLVRQHFGDAQSVFVCPHVPPKKEQAARRAHVVHLPARERILALYDATWLGSGDEGFVVTAKRLCWKNARQGACSILWQDVDPDRLWVESGRVIIGDDAVLVSEDAVLDACANAFHVLALSGHLWGLPAAPKASGHVPRFTPIPSKTLATPPPAHTTSYHHYASHAELSAPDRCCWHCRTPLHKTTPQCSYCGAFPKKKGWLRAG